MHRLLGETETSLHAASILHLAQAAGGGGGGGGWGVGSDIRDLDNNRMEAPGPATYSLGGSAWPWGAFTASLAGCLGLAGLSSNPRLFSASRLTPL